jgi:hypothetical protein
MKAAQKPFPIVFLLFAVLVNSCVEAKNTTILTPQSTITVEPSQANTPYLTQRPTFTPSPAPDHPTNVTVVPLSNTTAKLSSPYENVKVAYNDQGWLWVWKNGSGRAIAPVGLYTTLLFPRMAK